MTKIQIKIPKTLSLTKESLNKGEKRIKVKGTSKRKAHYRTIKGTEDKPIKSLLSNVLDFYESTIKNQDFESCGAFKDDGTILMQKDGQKDYIRFNESEKILCKGSTFTHNHPSGSLSFSPEDIQWACQSEMKEMRVIARGGEKFTMSMKDGSNFSKNLWQEKILLTYKTMDNEVHDEFTEKISNKEMTIKEADDSHWDEVWRRTVKEIPEIIYNWVI